MPSTKLNNTGRVRRFFVPSTSGASSTGRSTSTETISAVSTQPEAISRADTALALGAPDSRQDYSRGPIRHPIGGPAQDDGAVDGHLFAPSRARRPEWHGSVEKLPLGLLHQHCQTAQTLTLAPCFVLRTIGSPTPSAPSAASPNGRGRPMSRCGQLGWCCRPYDETHRAPPPTPRGRRRMRDVAPTSRRFRDRASRRRGSGRGSLRRGSPWSERSRR